MKFRRCIGAMLAASVLLIAFGASEADAWGRRSVIPPVYNAYPYGAVYSQFNPYMYMAPPPAYGVMPLPLATWSMLGYDLNTVQPTSPFPTTDSIDYLPRIRPGLYPAVPYTPAQPEKGAVDPKRARFEITVPTADAVVLFDGVKTTQTGMTRVFVTPVLAEGKSYSSTIEAQWKDEAGTPLVRRKAFDFVAGQTITHKFAE